MNQLRETFRVLRNRSFRTFWIVVFLSNLGFGAQTVAQGWLVLELTGSPKWLGLITAASVTPLFLLAPVGGVFADRLNRRRLLGCYQAVMAIIALALGLLVQFHAIEAWHFLVAALATGIGTALSTPTIGSLVPELVSPAEVVRAVSLHVQQFQLSRTLGPLVAAGLFAVFGLPHGFYLNAISFVPLVVFCFASGDRRPPRPRTPMPPILASVREGVRFALDDSAMWRPIRLIAASSLALLVLPTLLPVISHTINDTPQLLAYLNGVAGAGAAVGALLCPALMRRVPLTALVRAAQIVTAAAFLGLAWARPVWLIMVLTALASASGMLVWVVITSTLQRTVKNEFRGRILSFTTMALGAGTVVGHPIAGALSERYGLSVALVVESAILVVTTLLLLRTPGALGEPPPADDRFTG